MGGLIKRDVIDAVRDRADIRSVVETYVSLRSSGVGSYKGLCPFHDERTPSFYIRTSTNTYHCFGCGEGGDVISFLQKQDHTTFAETVEKLAQMTGIPVEYEDGGTGAKPEEIGRRRRLLDAHKIAEEFFAEKLKDPEAAPARAFLAGRGFDGQAARDFGCGYAPQGWDALLKHLTSKGFTREELLEGGLVSQGQRGVYDRFRGRLIWPIRDLTGATIGFGARKLYEDDQGPKYLNTPETPLYKKSQVLYGVDTAKKAISQRREIVVVEGYTDVMAARLAGIETAVATCGTAFGADHIKVARRLMRDDGPGGSVIFTFDGDEAGQRAALRAFEEDQKFVAQTYVVVEPNGMDPCDVRLTRGDQAVRDLIASKRPLFEFAIRSQIARFDVSTAEGRVGALRAAAEIVSQIRDSTLRPEYARQLSQWLGMDLGTVEQAVGSAGRSRGSASRTASMAEQPARPSVSLDLRDPVTRLERDVMAVALQMPQLLDKLRWPPFTRLRLHTPALAAVHVGILAAARNQVPLPRWVAGVAEHVPDELRPMVYELSALPVPARDEDSMLHYGAEVLGRISEMNITRQKADLVSELSRLDPEADRERAGQVSRALLDLEKQRRALRRD
ncbi:DNA primase [Falsarthrobacter nasiphocae]|uniref:DNA primase n=1 Tax=Falsarthrobacter nasiphocae TaxID=189863 RepID=A0AAE3YH49_9MICC|nr:DNA primase [Falsarthrobacter nasiphocae]MDR6892622.1 DNA primase [Falsarthrobacter nasiphocae]